MQSNDELRSKLQELRQRLQVASSVSAAERDRFSSLITDVIAEFESDQEQAVEGKRSFVALLEEKSSSYEIDHPEIAYLVRQVLDILTKMGI
jgi:hypothetical protein